MADCVDLGVGDRRSVLGMVRSVETHVERHVVEFFRLHARRDACFVQRTAGLNVDALDLASAPLRPELGASVLEHLQDVGHLDGGPNASLSQVPRPQTPNDLLHRLSAAGPLGLDHTEEVRRDALHDCVSATAKSQVRA